MKTFITFFISVMLFHVVAGQPYQDGREYKAKNNTYKCKYSIAKSSGRHYYEFTNTKNVLKGMKSGLIEYSPIPVLESERKLMELLCDAYDGKEKMQMMQSEKIHLYFYIGMDSRVRELRITISSDTESIKTTIFQVETVENLIRERIRFIFDRNSIYYRNAIYLTAGSITYKISEIPELLEKTP